MARKKGHAGAILIRPVSSEDIPKIARIGSQCFPDSDVSEEKTLSRISRGHFIFVAEYNRKVVGFLDMKMGIASARVYGLATDPAFRGKGAGTALLSYGVDFSRRAGKMSILLRVAVRNLRALSLYEKLGFFVVSSGRIKGGKSIYLMERKFET
ncbi:MAG: GNAT family N-acetyltransferase [Candidatus Micrarchaeota archaeon]